MAGRVWIGTSGFHYKHWRGPFYPEKLPMSHMLESYLDRFDTVELNNTFYRLPTVPGVENWRDSTPEDFIFAAKGSRFITHMKKLKDPDLAIERYFERVDRLGSKLGAIVFQLPPFWGIDVERLKSFLSALPPGKRYAFEFRNAAWHVEEVYQLLRGHNAAWCTFDIGGVLSPIILTADFTYLRLHGPGGPYQGSYSHAALSEWADRISSWKRTLNGVYVYFDNDMAGFAPRNALELKSLVNA